MGTTEPEKIRMVGILQKSNRKQNARDSHANAAKVSSTRNSLNWLV